MVGFNLRHSLIYHRQLTWVDPEGTAGGTGNYRGGEGGLEMPKVPIPTLL